MNANYSVSHLLRPRRDPTHRFMYVGVPLDAATTLGNPGARNGPPALREAMRSVFEWRLREGRLADLDFGILDLSGVEVADLGDIALSYHSTEQTVEEICTAVRFALAEGYTPLVVGGDHSVTYPAVKGLHDHHPGRIGLIQLDAHCDLMQYSDRQGRYSGSSGMMRSLELDRLSGKNLVQVGLRGFTMVEQYQAGEELGIRRINSSRFSEIGPRAAAEQSLAWAQDGTDAVYLTVDLDVVNPGEAPGTGWPEPGGLTGQELLDFVRFVAPHATVIDVAELNPIFDSRSRTTVVLAARLLVTSITSRLQSSLPGAGRG
ncbi:MAG: arginase family protein [Anaerolineales bacterium]